MGGCQHFVIEVGDSSVVEIEGWHSVVGAGDDSSVIEMVAPETLPQVPVAVSNSIKQGIEDKEDIEEDRKETEEEGEEEGEEEDKVN